MIRLRRTKPADLDFVLALERAPENARFIGQWSREEHVEAIERGDREHWIVEREVTGERLGYLIAYDLVAQGHGVYVKRIVVAEKSRGIGRAALERFCAQRAADTVWLTVFENNRQAQRAYAAAGFERREMSARDRAELHAAVGGFSDESVVMGLQRLHPADG